MKYPNGSANVRLVFGLRKPIWIKAEANIALIKRNGVYEGDPRSKNSSLKNVKPLKKSIIIKTV